MLKRMELAERMQDVFQAAYGIDQPYATKEENVNDIYNHLDDKDYVGLTLDALDEIKEKYHLGLDEEINSIISELEKIQTEISIKIKCYCTDEQLYSINEAYHSVEEIWQVSENERLDDICNQIMALIEEMALYITN